MVVREPHQQRNLCYRTRWQWPKFGWKRRVYLSIPSGILSNLGDVTVSAWVYLNANQKWARVFDFGFSTGRYLMFAPANGNLVAHYGIVLDGAAQTILGAEAVPTGQWVHVAGTG